MKKPLYQIVYEKLEKQIIKKEWKLNEKLPSESELASQFNVSSITIKRALNELKNQGYLSRKPKEGTIVISNKGKITTTQKLELHNFTIGLIVTNLDDTFGTSILNGILDHCPPGVNIILKKTMGNEKKEDEIIREFIQSDIDGIILLPSSSQFLAPTILDLAAKKFPIVVIDRTLNNLPISCITSNNIEAAEKLTSYLMELGHKNIGILTSTNLVSSVKERIQGYIQAHAANQVKMDQALQQSFIQSVVPNYYESINSDQKKIMNFIQSQPQMTAIVAAEYNIAQLIKQACQKIDKNIPNELSICCFDYPANLFSKEDVAFTHIEQQQYEMGEAAVKQVLQQIQSPEKIIKKVLNGRLILGSSTTFIPIKRN